MKKVTVILGSGRAGKTKKAQELIAGRKAQEFTGWRMSKLKDLHEDTEVIVIYELTKRDIEQVKYLLCCETLKYRPAYGVKPVELCRPDIIIVSEELTRDDFGDGRRIDVVITL